MPSPLAYLLSLKKRRSARQTGKRKKYLDDIDLHLSDEETTPQMASVLADISMDGEGLPGSSNVSILGADEVAGTFGRRLICHLLDSIRF